MTRKTKTNWLDRAIVFGPFMALFSDETSYLTEMKRLEVKNIPPFLPDSANACVHCLHRDGDQMSIVCIDRNRKFTPLQAAAILTHEAVHIWQNFKRHIGEDNPSSEFEAYAIQNITQTLLEEYERQTKATRNARRRI